MSHWSLLSDLLRARVCDQPGVADAPIRAIRGRHLSPPRCLLSSRAFRMLPRSSRNVRMTLDAAGAYEESGGRIFARVGCGAGSCCTGSTGAVNRLTGLCWSSTTPTHFKGIGTALTRTMQIQTSAVPLSSSVTIGRQEDSPRDAKRKRRRWLAT